MKTVIIVIEGGNLQAIKTNDPEIQFVIQDHDNLAQTQSYNENIFSDARPADEVLSDSELKDALDTDWEYANGVIYKNIKDR